jgi:signal peptidase I
MRSTLREVFETIVLTILIFLLVRSVVQNFKVDGQSMEPTLFNGQYLLVNKAIYWELDLGPLTRVFPTEVDPQNPKVSLFREPARGDIVVFRPPQSPEKDYIKRIVGVPGDRVEIKNGKVLVNGVPLSEPYIKDPPLYEAPPVVVPEDSYYVLGDHRNNSSDSHVWGVVPRDNIVGVAWVSYWPPAQWGLLSGASLRADGTP